jgi:hypothetical protein
MDQQRAEMVIGLSIVVSLLSWQDIWLYIVAALLRIFYPFHFILPFMVEFDTLMVILHLILFCNLQ